MPFEIVRNDITNMQVDAIVNTANPRPVIGLGTDSRIHEKAGPELLLARQRIGEIAPGQAAITPAYRLHARYVIHTVGPVWEGGGHDEDLLLRSCYENALKKALSHNCQSIAFPLISTGNYGFPKDRALQIAISVFSAFLMEQEMQIYLVVFDKTAFQLTEKLFQGVASYIDEHYVEAWESRHYASPMHQELYRRERRMRDLLCDGEVPRTAPMMAPKAITPKAMTLEDALKAEDIGFSEALLKLIDQSGKKDSEIYKRANLSKQHFSKIRNNPDYKPTKPTAIALALALELDLKKTKELIGRAGYALTSSSKFDLIIQYFIQQKNYNIIEINIALYEFDQSLLGS